MNRKWNLIVVTLVALSAIVMGTASAVESMIIGPSGELTDAVDQLPCGITAHQVILSAGWWMGWLQMAVKAPDGTIQLLGMHGYGAGGSPAFTLADGEYITEVSGDFTPEGLWSPVLYTIEFTTNLATYGPYGANGGTLNDGNPTTPPGGPSGDYPGIYPFDYEAPDGWQIVGFTTNPAGVGAITSLGVIAIPVAECCKDVECQDTPEDAPCVKCDLETTTCTAPGEGNPHMMCDDGCVNTQNDDFNCGECGIECEEGQKCVSGECKGKKITE